MRALKRRALDLYARLMFGLGVSHPRRIAADRFLILTFHRVLPESLRSRYPIPGLVVTPEELHWIVATLLPFFEVGTVSANNVRQSEGAGRKPRLSISFDDGQIDNVTFAAPVLAALGVPATFYLPTDFVGTADLLWHDRAGFAWQSAALSANDRHETLRRLGVEPAADGRIPTGDFLARLKQLAPPRRAELVAWLCEQASLEAPEWAMLMSWEDAGALERAGHEIGSHCQSHELLPQLDAAEQTRELRTSFEVIADALPSRRGPRSVCYPNGDCSAETLELARAAGYDNGVTTRWGINRPDRDRLALLRCDMDARRLYSTDGALSAARLGVRILGHQPGLH